MIQIKATSLIPNLNRSWHNLRSSPVILLLVNWQTSPPPHYMLCAGACTKQVAPVPPFPPKPHQLLLLRLAPLPFSGHTSSNWAARLLKPQLKQPCCLMSLAASSSFRMELPLLYISI